MKHSNRKDLISDENVPSDLTFQLVARLQNLPSSAKADYLMEQFLSKFVSSQTDPAITRRTRAINKWLATERENEATNERLLITPGHYKILPGVTFVKFVGWCGEFVRRIIGDTCPEEALIGSFSGGASTSRKRAASFPASKYTGTAHVTARCAELWDLISPSMPAWTADGSHLLTEVVPGNVLFTVPKKTDIDRCACKEPDLNMFIQKGIGNHFRKCLRRAGINLNDQSKNQSLARVGSLDNSLATLDLSSASDSVSEGLVALLLPETWYTLLDAARCQVTIIDGEEHRNHMFSSMGNGFTFELESLLFFTIAKATAYFTRTRGVISVYGDDIICPAGIAEQLTEVLSYLGFSVNTDKSFADGPFRESCGGHYRNGVDITPFYIREPITSIAGIIHAANSLRAWSVDDKDRSPIMGLGFRGSYEILDLDVEEIWLWLKSHVPECLWGGTDTSYKYQLVSCDTPSRRLSEETANKGTGTGGYLHWLNLTWDREYSAFEQRISESQAVVANWDRTVPSDGVETSSRTESKSRLRLRNVRNKAVPRLRAVFLSEVGS